MHQSEQRCFDGPDQCGSVDDLQVNDPTQPTEDNWWSARETERDAADYTDDYFGEES